MKEEALKELSRFFTEGSTLEYLYVVFNILVIIGFTFLWVNYHDLMSGTQRFLSTFFFVFLMLIFTVYLFSEFTTVTLFLLIFAMFAMMAAVVASSAI